MSFPQTIGHAKSQKRNILRSKLRQPTQNLLAVLVGLRNLLWQKPSSQKILPWK